MGWVPGIDSPSMPRRGTAAEVEVAASKPSPPMTRTVRSVSGALMRTLLSMPSSRTGELVAEPDSRQNYAAQAVAHSTPSSERAASIGPSSAARPAAWAMALIAGVAALNFSWQLGASSYFVDEVLSVHAASAPVHELLDTVRAAETTPWTYFLFLHEWLLRTGTQDEWVARLPSVVAGVSVVLATGWLAWLFVGRHAALVAGALAALSPLFLQYAQQARVYAFAMLAGTICAGAAVRATRSVESSTRWLVAAGVAGVASLWLHYTATLVVVPVCAWVATRHVIPRRGRVAFAGACAAAQLLLLPLAVDQFGNQPNGGVVGIASLTAKNAIRVLETPFDGRWANGIDIASVVGVAVVVVSLSCAFARREALRDRGLLFLLALTPLVAIILLGAVGRDLVLTRYTAVAAPFLLVAVAAAVTTTPRALGTTLLVVALAVAATGLVRSHRRGGFYPDARAAVAYIDARWRAGDVIVTPGQAGFDIPIAYYGGRRLRPPPRFVESHDRSAVAATYQSGARVWFVFASPGPGTSARSLLRLADGALARVRYGAVSARTFPGSATLGIVLAAPAAPR